MSIEKPIILGMGGVGMLVAEMLKEHGMSVTGMDIVKPNDFPEGIAFVEKEVKDYRELMTLFGDYDAVISCLPYHLTLDVARAAHGAKIYYSDPTEDVKTTEEIRVLAETSVKTMIPQNGLAPGFI